MLTETDILTKDINGVDAEDMITRVTVDLVIGSVFPC